MNDIIHHGSCHNMILTLDDPQKYNKDIAKINGKRFEIIVREEKSRRSDAGNRYYWGVVIDIITTHFNGIATNADKDNVHEGLKRMFLTMRDDATGLDYVGSTAKLKTVEFWQYIAQVVKWAAEQGIDIPEPNETELPKERYF